MPARRRYPAELRDRAVQLVVEATKDDPGVPLMTAAARVGQQMGVKPSTLRNWCRQATADEDGRPSQRAMDAARIKRLQAENRELRRANEVLAAAYSLAAREFDPAFP